MYILYFSFWSRFGYAKVGMVSNMFWSNTWPFALRRGLKIELKVLHQPSIFVLPKKV